MSRSIVTKGTDETEMLGARLAASLKRGYIVALTGPLGSGKTVFAKGLARGLGVRGADRVNSPSFVILKEYNGRLPLYHFDVYRFDRASELSSVGFREYFYGDGICVIEWADKIREFLPDEYLKVNITILGPDSRRFLFSSRGPEYEKVVKKL